eukprot:g5197.t1
MVAASIDAIAAEFPDRTAVELVSLNPGAGGAAVFVELEAKTSESQTFAQIRETSLKIAHSLAFRHDRHDNKEGSHIFTSVANDDEDAAALILDNPQAVVVASWLPRGALWYALYVACDRLGVVFLALDPSNVEWSARAAKAAQPQILVVPGDDEIKVHADEHDGRTSLSRNKFQMNYHTDLEKFSRSRAGAASEITCLCATGGTTSSGPAGGRIKIARCTRAMVQSELRNYPRLFAKAKVGLDEDHEERVLQPSALAWGAAVFGQINLALAVKGTLVIPPLELLADSFILEKLKITIAGLTPSVWDRVRVRGVPLRFVSEIPRSAVTSKVSETKLREQLAREDRFEAEDEVAGRSGPTLFSFLKIVADVLDLPTGAVNPDLTFSEHGGTSAAAIELLSFANLQGVVLSLTHLLGARSGSLRSVFDDQFSSTGESRSGFPFVNTPGVESENTATSEVWILFSMSHALCDQWGMMRILDDLARRAMVQDFAEVDPFLSSSAKRRDVDGALVFPSRSRAFEDFCLLEAEARANGLHRAQRFWARHFDQARTMCSGVIELDNRPGSLFRPEEEPTRTRRRPDGSIIAPSVDERDVYADRITTTTWQSFDSSSLQSTAAGWFQLAGEVGANNSNPPNALDAPSRSSLLHLLCQIAVGPSRSLLHLFAMSGVVGMSLRAAPLWLPFVAGVTSVSELARRTDATLREAMEHAFLSWREIRACAGFSPGAPLYSAVVVCHNRSTESWQSSHLEPFLESEMPTFSVVFAPTKELHDAVVITTNDDEDAGGPAEQSVVCFCAETGKLTYPDRVYSKSRMQALAAGIRHALGQRAEDHMNDQPSARAPDQYVEEAVATTKRKLSEGSTFVVDAMDDVHQVDRLPEGVDVIDLIVQQARRTPHKTAISLPGWWNTKDLLSEVTYAEMLTLILVPKAVPEEDDHSQSAFLQAVPEHRRQRVARLRKSALEILLGSGGVSIIRGGGRNRRHRGRKFARLQMKLEATLREYPLPFVGESGEREVEIFCVLRSLFYMGYYVPLPKAGEVPEHRIRAMKRAISRRSTRKELSRSKCFGAVVEPGILLHTSGSTGNPKAVAVTNRNVLSHLWYLQNKFPLQPTDCALSCISWQWVASFPEIFNPILVGARLLVSEFAKLPELGFFQHLREEVAGVLVPHVVVGPHPPPPVSVAQFVPSVLSAMAGDRVDLGEGAPALRRLVLTGEAFPTQFLPLAFKIDWLLNHYGQTEVSDTTTLCQIRPGDVDEYSSGRLGVVPLGRPTAYRRCEYAAATKWAAGELTTQGPGLGYYLPSGESLVEECRARRVDQMNAETWKETAARRRQYVRQKQLARAEIKARQNETKTLGQSCEKTGSAKSCKTKMRGMSPSKQSTSPCSLTGLPLKESDAPRHAHALALLCPGRCFQSGDIVKKRTPLVCEENEKEGASRPMNYTAVVCGSEELLSAGRRDNQTKVNGMRVDLQEIEAVCRDVLVVGDGGGGGQEVLCQRLREACVRNLPRAFVPTAFFVVDKWPRLATGKIHKEALERRYTATLRGRSRAGDRAGFHESYAHSEKYQEVLIGALYLSALALTLGPLRFLMVPYIWYFLGLLRKWVFSSPALHVVAYDVLWEGIFLPLVEWLTSEDRRAEHDAGAAHDEITNTKKQDAKAGAAATPTTTTRKEITAADIVRDSGEWFFKYVFAFFLLPSLCSLHILAAVTAVAYLHDTLLPFLIYPASERAAYSGLTLGPPLCYLITRPLGVFVVFLMGFPYVFTDDASFSIGYYVLDENGRRDVRKAFACSFGAFCDWVEQRDVALSLLTKRILSAMGFLVAGDVDVITPELLWREPSTGYQCPPRVPGNPVKTPQYDGRAAKLDLEPWEDMARSMLAALEASEKGTRADDEDEQEARRNTPKERLINSIADSIVAPVSGATANEKSSGPLLRTRNRDSTALDRRTPIQVYFDSLRLMLFASKLNAAGLRVQMSDLLACGTLSEVYQLAEIADPTLFTHKLQAAGIEETEEEDEQLSTADVVARGHILCPEGAGGSTPTSTSLFTEHRRLYRTVESEGFHRIDVPFTLCNQQPWDRGAVYASLLLLINRHSGLRLSYYDPGEFLKYMQSAASHCVHTVPASSSLSWWAGLLSGLVYTGWGRCTLKQAVVHVEDEQNFYHEDEDANGTTSTRTTQMQTETHLRPLVRRCAQAFRRYVQVLDYRNCSCRPQTDAGGDHEPEDATRGRHATHFHDVLPQVRAVLYDYDDGAGANVKHYMRLHFNHGVVDGGSANPLLRDFAHFYKLVVETRAGNYGGSFLGPDGGGTSDADSVHDSVNDCSSSDKSAARSSSCASSPVVIDPREDVRRMIAGVRERLTRWLHDGTGGSGKTQKKLNRIVEDKVEDNSNSSAQEQREEEPKPILAQGRRERDQLDAPDGGGRDERDRAGSEHSLSLLSRNAMAVAERRLRGPLLLRSRVSGHDLMPWVECSKRLEDFEYWLEFSPRLFLPYLARKYRVTLDNVVLGLFAVAAFRFLHLSPSYRTHVQKLAPFCSGNFLDTFRVQVVAPLRDDAGDADLVANLVSQRILRLRFAGSATVEDAFRLVVDKVRRRDWETANSLERCVHINLRSSVRDTGEKTISQEFQYPARATRAAAGNVRRKGSRYPNEYPLKLMIDQLSDEYDYVAWVRSWECLFPGKCGGEVFHDLLEDSIWALLRPPTGSRRLVRDDPLRDPMAGAEGGLVAQRESSGPLPRHRRDEDYFPSTTSWREQIEHRITDFAVTVLEKKLLIVITQCGKIGSWITATVDGEPCITDPAFAPDQTYETTVLFGARSDGTEYQRVYARRLIELIYKANPEFTSLILGIAMKTPSPKTFRACVESIQKRFA